MDKSIAALIIGLEKELLEHEVRVSPERLNHLLADDFLEFGQSGNVYTKMDTINALPQQSEETFVVSDAQAKELSADTVLLTYELGRTDASMQSSRSRRSSIWQKRGETWQMIFHQGTPIIDASIPARS